MVPEGSGPIRLSPFAPEVTLDFGRNVSGVLEIRFSGASAGAELAVMPAERRRYLRASSLGGDMRWDAAGSDDGPRAPRIQPGPGVSVWSSPGVMGAQRWARLALTRPGGTVEIESVRLRYTPYRPGREYPGWFLSSDPELNRIWFASAYTAQLNHLREPELILDGAKRDRLVWSGDLLVAGPTELLTTGRRRAVRNSLALLARRQRPDGYIPANGDPAGARQPFEDLSFPSYVALWIVALEDYVLRTGDARFAERMAPVVRRALRWLDARTGASGLLELRDGDLTWHPPDSPLGAVGEANASWYAALAATGRRRQAQRVRRAFLRRLELPGGLFALSADEQVGVHDTTAAAVFHGLARRPARALRALRRELWTPLGPATIAGEHPGMTRFVSPYITSLELIARGRSGDVRGGLEMLRRTWRHFQTEDPGGTDWERLGLDGEPQPFAASDGEAGKGFTSLAHAWSTGPVRFLTEYVLGVRPLEPGYRRYAVAPNPGGLRWARGRVPTPRGAIEVWWRVKDGRMKLVVKGPRGAVVQRPAG